MTIPSSRQNHHEVNHQQYHAQGDPGGVKMVADYALQQRLGSGSFATVYKGVKVVDSSGRTETVAIKAIARNSEKITKKVLENLELEISILQTYRHPNIVCLHQVHKTEHHFYLLLEYCAGGDVQRLIRSRKSGRLTEGLARRLMRDLTAGLKFLWGQELIHRDIKPQNLLLTGPLPLDEVNDPSKLESEEDERKNVNFPTNLFQLKIADFGFARHLQTTSLADTLCGSPLYMAPEILQHRRYDAKADLWSAGTVLFEMIAGRPPFHGENHIDLLRNIQQKAVRLPPDVKVSKECVKLLRLLLNRNPLSRAGFKDFIEASTAFSALGCNGSTSTYDSSSQNMAIECKHQSLANTNLGPISEAGESFAPGAGSLATVATHDIQRLNSHLSHQHQPGNSTKVPEVEAGPQHYQQTCVSHQGSTTPSPPQSHSLTQTLSQVTPFANNQINGHPKDTHTPNMVSPVLGSSKPSQQPSVLTPQSSSSKSQYETQQQQRQILVQGASKQCSHFTPLEPSPPGPKHVSYSEGISPPPLSLGNNIMPSLNQTLNPSYTEANFLQQSANPQRRGPEMSQTSEDGGFVMVEHGGYKNNALNPPATSNKCEDRSNQRLTHSPFSMQMWKSSNGRRVVPSSLVSGNTSQSPPMSPGSTPTRYYSNKPILSSRTLIRPALPYTTKGMLSTSPGTGGALVGMMGSVSGGNVQSGAWIGSGGQQDNSQNENRSSNSNKFYTMGTSQTGGVQTDIDIGLLTQMLAAAEDVGRRAVNVAHLGDTRAYLAMRLLVMTESGSSLLSATPMEGVVEESDDGATQVEETSSSLCAFPTRRLRSVSNDRMSVNLQSKEQIDEEEDDGDNEMPFAMAASSNESHLSATPLNFRQNNSNVIDTIAYSKQPSVRASQLAVLVHFREALLCYIKALSMLKGSVNAAQHVLKDLVKVSCSSANNSIGNNSTNIFKKRCDVSHAWLTAQFKGVLERADAANIEIGKIQLNQSAAGSEEHENVEQGTDGVSIVTVEELVYNHSLACGRDGAVKQLLGQYDAARTCYRSAGLLAETLLMEPKLGEDDRKILEEYVQGFSERITEVDTIMLQQGRQAQSHGSGGIAMGSTEHEGGTIRRGSGVIGLVGGVVPSNCCEI